MMRERIVIIADDLTGAADSASRFAELGLDTALIVDSNAAADPGRSVTAWNTNIRNMPGDAAMDTLAHILIRLAEPETEWTAVYLKIDSVLRGHVAQSVETLLHQFPGRPVIIAPAFPANGRITREGVQQADGVPVHLHELGRDLLSPAAESDLRIMLAGVGGRNVRYMPVERISEETFAENALYICDAERDEHLDAIVRAVFRLPLPWLLVGSGGLSAALARGSHDRRAGQAMQQQRPQEPQRQEPQEQGPPEPLEQRLPHTAVLRGDLSGKSAQWQSSQGQRQSTLVVSASMKSITRRQIEDAARRCSFIHQVAVEAMTVAVQYGDDRFVEETARRIADGISRGGSVLFHIQGTADGDSGRLSAAILTFVAEVTKLACDRSMPGALLLVGGDTACSILKRLGLFAIDIVGELYPGVPICRSYGNMREWIVATKSGGFGTDTTIAEIIHRLEGLQL